jgi:hypothetical protein
MSRRYKFGPQIVGVFPRPVVSGELPDVEVNAQVKGVRPGISGTIEMDVAFGIPAHDPAQFSMLVEVHAISFAPGHGIPTDAALAVASNEPKATASIAPAQAGQAGETMVTIVGAPSGQQTVVTVLVFEDPDPPAASPAS